MGYLRSSSSQVRPWARTGSVCAGMGDVVIADAAMTGPQPPILPLSTGATGRYLSVRSSPSDGACGVHGYPCKHPGFDVRGAEGTIVRAPEDGTIVIVADGSAPPFEGYGPYLTIVKGKSGYFHLLAHLEPGSMAKGVGGAVSAGEAIATTSNANHTHWEVRKKPVPDFAHGEDNFANNIDPLVWLSSARGGLGKVLLIGGSAVALALALRRRR